ncbi:MAG: GTP-binding protein [Solidesulfovibrio sp.]
MDISRLLPPGRETLGPEDVARLPVTALLLACLAPRFKRLTGWLGYAPCPGGLSAWTCRLEARPGVFGCLGEAFWEQEGLLAARFGLHYFPTVDEPMFERFSLAAELAAVSTDFKTKIRAFPASPEMRDLFRIGQATMGLACDRRALFLRLDALERDRIILQTGIRSQDDWVVPPGGTEQDLPAWQLAHDLFAAVAAALAFCLGEPPRRLARSSLPGRKRTRLADGSFCDELSAASPLRAESLAWGETALFRQETLGFPGAADRRVWSPGDDLPADASGDPCWRAHDLDATASVDSTAEAVDQRPGLVILSGFLGAGKTSMLLEMLEYHRAHDRFVAVIQNEIGATGVDGYLIDGGESTLTLDEGCVCCTLSGSLASGIKRLTERFRPERIILETSGLANPLNLLAEKETWSPLARLEMVVAVVDAVHGLEMLNTSEVARDQVRGGDVLLINKCDLAEEAGLAALRARLREENPRASMLETSHGRIHPGLLFDEVGDGPETADARTAQIPLLKRRNHMDEAFCAVRLPQPEGLTLRGLNQWLDRLPPQVFRVKGVVCLSDVDGPQVLQGVGGRREVRPLGREFPDEPFLVFIGHDLDKESLAACRKNQETST